MLSILKIIKKIKINNIKCLDLCMSFIGPLGNLMFYFQAYRIFTLKEAQSVSLMGFIISMVAMASWLFYGIIIKNKPLIIANVLGVIGAALVILGVLLYRSG